MSESEIGCIGWIDAEAWRTACSPKFVLATIVEKLILVTCLFGMSLFGLSAWSIFCVIYLGLPGLPTKSPAVAKALVIVIELAGDLAASICDRGEVLLRDGNRVVEIEQQRIFAQITPSAVAHERRLFGVSGSPDVELLAVVPNLGLEVFC